MVKRCKKKKKRWEGDLGEVEQHVLGVWLPWRVHVKMIWTSKAPLGGGRGGGVKREGKGKEERDRESLEREREFGERKREFRERKHMGSTCR